MKNYYSFFSLLLCWQAAAARKYIHLRASIKGLPSDTILVFLSRIRTSWINCTPLKGKFLFTLLPPDTFTIFHYYWEKKKQILPIHADKGESVTLNGMVGEIEG